MGTLSLFTSLGTLVCCALPALFVALGAGAVLAGVVSNLPQLIWLSQHKVGVFMTAGVLIAVSAFMRFRSRNEPCPVGARRAMACVRLRRLSGIVLYISIAIYSTGFFFAFIARYFLELVV